MLTKVKPLTEEQKRLAEDNHNLIYGFLRRRNYSIEEWYGVAAIGLCKAAAVFDPAKGYAFSTIAYVCMKRAIYGVKRDMRSQKRDGGAVISLDAEQLEDVSLLGKTPDHVNYADEAIVQLELKEFLASVPRWEREVLQRSMVGMTQVEIARAMGVSQPHIGRTLKKQKAEFDRRYAVCV